MSAAGLQPDRLARGAGRGFNVLLIGGLLAPLAGYLPVVGLVWLALVAVAAFSFAGLAIRDVPNPAIHGAMAAVGSYLLILPLVVMATRQLDLTQVLITSLTAVLVGAAVGRLASLSARHGSLRNERTCDH